MNLVDLLTGFLVGMSFGVFAGLAAVFIVAGFYKLVRR